MEDYDQDQINLYSNFKLEVYFLFNKILNKENWDIYLYPERYYTQLKSPIFYADIINFCAYYQFIQSHKLNVPFSTLVAKMSFSNQPSVFLSSIGVDGSLFTESMFYGAVLLNYLHVKDIYVVQEKAEEILRRFPELNASSNNLFNKVISLDFYSRNDNPELPEPF